jgi:hypothetical protein
MKRSAAFREVEHIVDADAIAVVPLADALRQRTADFFLFTPALLTTHSEFDRDPVIEFAVRMPANSADLRPFCVDLTRDKEFFFSGLGSRPSPRTSKVINWDRRLYCIDATRKEECISFFGGILFSNPASGVFGRSFYYEITLQDPTVRKYAALSVGVVGVRTNKYVAFLHPRLHGPARVVVTPVEKLHLCPSYIIDACALSGPSDSDPLRLREDKYAK